MTNACSGFTLKAPTITSITSSAGTGAVITCSLVATSVGNLVITNGDSNYGTAPNFVFTPVSGGSGASATPTINLGTAGVLTPSFYKTFTYTWNGIPPLVINDLAKLSAVNIIATGFTASTLYTYRILGLQYDSRDSFFLFFQWLKIQMCVLEGVLEGGEFCIILTPQTTQSITISVDDDITNKGSGQAYAINLVIAIEIEEYDPITTETEDPYSESVSRLKHQLG